VHLPHLPLTLLCLTVSALTLPSQRGVRTLTTSGVAHSEPRLSPNGKWVAFKTAQNGLPALGIIHTDPNSIETILFSSNTLTHYRWSPDSAGLYFQDGNLISHIRTVGGTPRSIRQVSGSGVRLMAVDPGDKFVLGTRGDSNSNHSIFSLPTDGQSLPNDLLTIQFFYLDHVTIDPSGQKIGYTSQLAGTPFAPIDIRRVDVDGNNDTSLSAGPIPDANRQIAQSLPRDLSWADNGTTLTFTAADNTTTAFWQVFRVSPTQNIPQPLTGDGQYVGSSVARDQNWMVCSGVVRHSAPPAHFHTVPVLLPAAGGARVPLEPEEDWVIAGAPSIDGFGAKVAFAGYRTTTPGSPRAEVHLIELDREIEVSPRPTLNQSIVFKLPLFNGERGTLFLSTGVVDPDPKLQFALPGFTYRVALQPTVLFPLLTGVGNASGSISISTTVPNDPALVGFTVYLQGMRIIATNPDKGDFTRYAELRFFD
jgi:hypothetical protein